MSSISFFPPYGLEGEGLEGWRLGCLPKDLQQWNMGVCVCVRRRTGWGWGTGYRGGSWESLLTLQFNHCILRAVLTVVLWKLLKLLSKVK